MNTSHSTTPQSPRAAGRRYLWAGLGLCVLGIGLLVVQYSLQQLIVPWYLPILSTIGAGLVLYSVVRRPGVVRVLALVLVVALAGMEWVFLTSLSRLPDYVGPARPGRRIAPFRTALADGRAFTDADLRDGRPRVLVFFRGRW